MQPLGRARYTTHGGKSTTSPGVYSDRQCFNNSLTFTAYKPKTRSDASGRWNTAGEMLFQRDEWAKQLQNAKKTTITDGQPLPLVVYYSKEHYSNLLYTRQVTRSIPAQKKLTLNTCSTRLRRTTT